MDNEKTATQATSGHRTDALAQKLDLKAEAFQTKKEDHGLHKKDDGPAGGFDETSIPRAPAGYTVKFTFHSAHNLPFADLNTLSSDPYVMAVLQTKLATRHKQDPPMRWRTPTIRRSVQPVWDSEWIVANVPASGFALKARLYDEDPGDHDDRLGNVHVHVEQLSENFPGIKEQAYKIKKRMGSKRAYLIRGCSAMFQRSVQMSGDLIVSVEVLGRTEIDNGGHLYTVGPCNWTRHVSPMIGRLAGTKSAREGKDGKKTENYNFQANQMQLAGPVPAALYHRYVEFKPFVKGMFTGKSLRGWILHRALHHQHNRIYNYSRDTVYGSFPSPSREMSLKFLDLVHYDEGGRIYTYVIMLDGQWRFTETGKEFGIDLLSKHTMHSDINIYIAFSGEFFVRRVNSPHKGGSPDDQPTHPAADLDGGPPTDEPPKDPAYYSLIIDNDSGTYRPNAKCLPELKAFMEKQLPGLKVVTLDCNGDKDKMNKWKEEQREMKKSQGPGVVMQQRDDSSVSSSDEEDLDAMAAHSSANAPKKSKKEKVKAKVDEPIEKLKDNEQGKVYREKRETADDLAGANGTAHQGGTITPPAAPNPNATAESNVGNSAMNPNLPSNSNSAVDPTLVSSTNTTTDPSLTSHNHSTVDPILTSQHPTGTADANPTPHPNSAAVPR